MTNFEYREIGPVSHAEAEKNLRSSNPQLIANTLIAMGLHDDDWIWVQQHALNFLSNKNEIVVSAAILSLAHTARVNKSIDTSMVMPALEKLTHHPRLAGKAQDALDDISVYVK